MDTFVVSFQNVVTNKYHEFVVDANSYVSAKDEAMLDLRRSEKIIDFMFESIEITVVKLKNVMWH